MANIIIERMTAKIDRDVVVFLIGMRINRFWKVRQWPLQYWRPFEDLERYAKDAARLHRPARAAFDRAVGSNGDIGIWHETHRVRPGDFECIYNNMPLFGLAKATACVPASGRRESASSRMAAT